MDSGAASKPICTITELKTLWWSGRNGSRERRPAGFISASLEGMVASNYETKRMTAGLTQSKMAKASPEHLSISNILHINEYI